MAVVVRTGMQDDGTVVVRASVNLFSGRDGAEFTHPKELTCQTWHRAEVRRDVDVNHTHVQTDSAF